MSKKPTWKAKKRAISSGEAGKEVAPSAELRPGSKRIRQYLDPQGNELIVVKGSKPYGSLTKAAFGNDPALHLLHGAEKGANFVAFDVGEDFLSLRGLARGTGKKNANLLVPVLEEVRTAIFDISGRAKVQELGIDDIAIDRIGDEALFLPPLEFEEGESDPQALIDGLAVSLGHDLITVFPPSNVIDLQRTLKGE
jgi:hypothetical protein